MSQSTPVMGGRGYSGHGPADRRRRLLRHGLPAAALALVAFVVGASIGAGGPSERQRVAERFAAAWARGDAEAAWSLLSAAAQRRAAPADLHRARAAALRTATATRLVAGAAGAERDGAVPVAFRVETRVFGRLRAPLLVPVVEVDGGPRVDWRPHAAFPGLRRGEALQRSTRLPTRATILARDGTVLAAGEDRTSPEPQLASTVVGSLEPPPAGRAAELHALGVPPGARVGASGLERWLDGRLLGRPGGELRAGRRVLARSVPVPADPVRSSIAPSVQSAATAALAGRLGGIVALDPRTGELLAAVGIGVSGLQPPGSVFKIVTLVGALEAGQVSAEDRFEPQTAATLEGVELRNAHGEACGGTLIEAFARSCNSVFAPMGAELGAERLVEVAERFGFNRSPGLPGAPASTIPPAEEIGDDLAVGATAIGQGRLLASPLQMALVAATIARRGVWHGPTAAAGERTAVRRITPPDVARVVQRGMRAVVRRGTGAAAALPDTGVAGKTGTAELRNRRAPAPEDGAPPEEADPSDTDAWFVAYAPASRPRVAVAVLLVGAGAGGETAAPAARTVLEAAVRRRG